MSVSWVFPFYKHTYTLHSKSSKLNDRIGLTIHSSATHRSTFNTAIIYSRDGGDMSLPLFFSRQPKIIPTTNLILTAYVWIKYNFHRLYKEFTPTWSLTQGLKLHFLYCTVLDDTANSVVRCSALYDNNKLNWIELKIGPLVFFSHLLYLQWLLECILGTLSLHLPQQTFINIINNIAS